MKNQENSASFEESFARLEAVVSQLENGQVTLDQSLILYEEGIHLIRACHEKLAGVKRKIEIITGLDEEGNPTTKPIQEDERSLEEKSQTRGRRRNEEEEEKNG